MVGGRYKRHKCEERKRQQEGRKEGSRVQCRLRQPHVWKKSGETGTLLLVSCMPLLMLLRMLHLRERERERAQQVTPHTHAHTHTQRERERECTFRTNRKGFSRYVVVLCCLVLPSLSLPPSFPCPSLPCSTTTSSDMSVGVCVCPNFFFFFVTGSVPIR